MHLGLEQTEEALKWIEKTNKRFSEKDIVKNPFEGSIKEVACIYLFEIQPVYRYFPFFVIGVVCITGVMFFRGFSWWLLPGALVLCSYFFWSPAFYYMMAYIALRKNGYKGKVWKII